MTWHNMQRISLVSLGSHGTNRKLSKECFMLRDSARHIFLHRIFMEICSSSLCTDPSFPQGEGRLYIGYAKEIDRKLTGLIICQTFLPLWSLILLVVPATKAVRERSASARRRHKTNPRTTLSQERLNHCNVHKETTNKLNTDDFGNQFVSALNDRQNRFWKFDVN